MKNNSDCKMCSALKRTPKSEETRRKISQALTGRTIPKNVVEKITNTLKQKFNTPEYKLRFSIQNGGENNPNFGNRYNEEIRNKISVRTKKAMNSNEVKQKMKEIQTSPEYKEKISKIHKGKIVSEKTKQKMREGVVRRVLKYGIRSRNFNPLACSIIDNYGRRNGYNFQHALNGGEFHIKGLGYLVDGYDANKNVVVEVDEKNHFDMNGNLREKDIIRQKRIEDHLHCKFIRIPFVKP